jgi:hypothetical protein
MELVADFGWNHRTQTSMSLIGRGLLIDPAEPAHDPMDVSVDWKGGSTHREHEDARRRLRADTGERTQVFVNALIIQFVEPGEIESAFALVDVRKDSFDSWGLLIGEPTGPYGVGNLFGRRVENLLPRREASFESGKRPAAIRVGCVLRQHSHDELVDDRSPGLRLERPLLRNQATMDRPDPANAHAR